MKLFLKHARDPVCVKRSIKVAFIVGTVLALINHFDAIFFGEITYTNIFQIVLTYLVPYTVSTYGSAMQARHIDLKDCKERAEKEELNKVSEEENTAQ